MALNQIVLRVFVFGILFSCELRLFKMIFSVNRFYGRFIFSDFMNSVSTFSRCYLY